MKKEVKVSDLVKIDENTYEIPKSFREDMKVPARLFANKEIIEDILTDKSLSQLANVSTLPGIQKVALAMPDIHQGYGFPIGGVAAMSVEDGVISPGGIGYDINCGIRLLSSDIKVEDTKNIIEDLATALFNVIPSGVGQGGKLKLSVDELDKVLLNVAKYMVEQGYGNQDDLEFCESNGCLKNANPEMVSERAKKRGADQLGTLGSGNHFLEVQVVEEIFDEAAAKAFDLKVGNLVVMIHCGSRGLGHQVCTDYVKVMVKKLPEWGIKLPDRELACAPFKSQEGQDYFSAMASAANFAWANRHLIGANVRTAWQNIFGKDAILKTVYDVAHNIGKVEAHKIDGVNMEVVVHRKGATRAFPPHHPEIPHAYQQVGQPVLIPGTMGTSSYILTGTEKGLEVSFGSSCHGAGRRLSRTEAKRKVQGPELRKQLEAKGITVRCDSNAELAEEAPIAYKDIENVIDVVVSVGLAKKVARVRPYAVIKGG